MQDLHTHDGDIMVQFVGGVSKLWSQLRSLSWVEVERIAKEKVELAIVQSAVLEAIARRNC